MEKFDNGAVWHGPWHKGLKSGSFGSHSNPHYAVKIGKAKQEDRFIKILSFFPFTSKKNNKCILKLPPGELHCGRKDAYSYLMPFRLLIQKNKLESNFSFKAFLTESRCQEAMKNYKELLKARKMKKHGKQ